MKSIFYKVIVILCWGPFILNGCVADFFNREKTDRHNAIEVGAFGSGSDRIGAYMDLQEAQLRKRLGPTGVSVTRKGENIYLNMPGNLTFASGSYNIKPKCYDALDSLAMVLNEYNKTKVNISGHTDSTGKPIYNKALSEKRAHSVATYLATQGVDPARILIEGFGELRPIASNKTQEGRTLNRRVAIQISPIE